MASTDLKQVESVFDFRDLRRFAGKSAAIKRPQEITQFSFDDQHVCHPLSDAGLKYYCMSLGLDRSDHTEPALI
jgi:RAT1-interacting protein